MESDKLEVVKAAAWAWYQRGSGSDHGNPNVREFDVTFTPIQRPYRPSRYKLEAMRKHNFVNTNTIEESSSQTPTTAAAATTTNSLLLDPYEIESISKRLDHLVEFSGTEFYKQLLSIDCDDIYQKNLVPPDSGMRKKKKSSSKLNLKRFLLRRAVVCGKSQDVDDRAFVQRR